VQQLFHIGFALFFPAVGIRAIVKMWHRPRTDPRWENAFPIYGPDFSIALCKCLVPFALFFVGMALVLIDPSLGGVTADLVIAAVCGAMMFMGSIVAFNWPKFIIPPALRDDPSTFTRKRNS
jgi:hypothetical protein